MSTTFDDGVVPAPSYWIEYSTTCRTEYLSSLVYLATQWSCQNEYHTVHRPYIVRLGVQHDPNGNENEPNDRKRANDPVGREDRLPRLELLLLERRVCSQSTSAALSPRLRLSIATYQHRQ